MIPCLLAVAFASTPSSPLSDASDLSAAGSADTSLATMLQQSDECAAGHNEGECALNALQLRGVSLAAESQSSGNDMIADEAVDGHHTEESTTTITLEYISGLLQQDAPGCTEACAALPEVALALFAVKQHPLNKFHGLLCANTERLAAFSSSLGCAVAPANAERCGPALSRLLEEWPEAPATPAALTAICEAAALPTNGSLPASTTSSEASVALLARAGAGDSGDSGALGEQLDQAVMTKKPGNPICKTASEGQTCIPQSHGGHSNQYIYCSAHREISVSPTNCEARRGEMSWCVGGGVGLTKNYCDDPFCRNGGAYAGNGLYCHSNSVVQCNGVNAPITRDSCSSRTSTHGCCTVTTYYKCRGTHPNPYCDFDYKSRDCSSCKHGHGYR